jgi:hypothetical protein
LEHQRAHRFYLRVIFLHRPWRWQRIVINIVLWLVILAALGAILWGSYAARSAGRTSLATRLLMALAIPGVLIGVLFLAILVLQPKWN